MENNTKLTDKALEFAKIAHDGQKRKNGEDFINHPIRVKEYLDQHDIRSTGNYNLFSKAILLMSLFVITYVHLVFFTPPILWAVLESLFFGSLIAAIGFNVMHDGSHGSFSKYAWLNKLASSSISVLGASRFMWGMKHVTIHHTYTNIDGVDDDIEVGVFMRMAPTQKY